MASAPFPGAQIEILIYMMLGAFMALAGAAAFYIRRLHGVLEEYQEQDDTPDFRTDNIGLSKRAEDVIDAVLEEPKYQNELPNELEVSKATVSNAVSELFDRNLVKKRKKANTYLIEPNIDELAEQQREPLPESK